MEEEQTYICDFCHDILFEQEFEIIDDRTNVCKDCYNSKDFQETWFQYEKQQQTNKGGIR